MENVTKNSDQSQKMSVSRIVKNKLSPAKSTSSKDPTLDDTQISSNVPVTTSYVIKSQRQKSKHAVAIYFTPIKERPEIALTEMQLCNDADTPLLFKLCSDSISSITASPAGSGCIPPRAEQRCYLTWRRSKQQQIQEDMKTPRLILITNFVAQEIDNNQTMKLYKVIIARIISEKERSDDHIPLMKFTFERKEVTASAKTISLQTAIEKSMEMDSARQEALKELNHYIQWFQQHPLETIIILLFIIALFIAISTQ